MKKLLAGLCLCLSLGSVAQAEDIKKVILDNEAQFVKAKTNEDRAAMEKLLCDEHTAIWSSGLVHDRKGHLASLGQHYVVKSLEQRDLKVTVYNDDTAIVTGVAETDAKLDGKPVVTHRHFTHVWVKQNGQWKIASIHVSPRKK